MSLRAPFIIYKATPALQKVLGVTTLTRPEGIQKVWEYIYSNDLYNKEKKRVVPNVDLKAIMPKDEVKVTEVC